MLIVEVLNVFLVDRVPQRLPSSRLFLRLLIDRCHKPRFMAVMTSGCAWLMWRTTTSTTGTGGTTLRAGGCRGEFLFYVYGFGRPSLLVPEVQWSVCVHSSIAEPTVMLLTVPVNGYTIVATAFVVTPYSSSADSPDSAAPCAAGVFASRCRSPGGAYDSVWDSVMPIAGKFLINYFQHHYDGGCVCMLNGWFSNNDDICADNYIFSRFKLKDKCRSEKWDVYLCGDMTILVVRVQVQFLDSVTCPLLLRQGMGS